MPSSHVKSRSLLREHEHVNCSTRVLFQWQRLHHHKVARLGSLDLHQLVYFLVYAEKVRVREFADFALEVLPVERLQLRGFFHAHLELQPVFETEVVDEAHASRAVARHDARIFLAAVGAPAEATLDFAIRTAGPTFTFAGVAGNYLSSLLQLLLVKFIFSHTHLLAVEVFDAELKATQLDYIKLLDFVTLLKH